MVLTLVFERVLSKKECLTGSNATEMLRRMCVNGEVLGFGDLEVSNDSSLQSYVVVNLEGQPMEAIFFRRLIVAIGKIWGGRWRESFFFK